MEKKKIIGGIQEKRCRMIGIAGSNVGVGCTHFSIMLANYLTGYLRRKAILLEFNESGDFERLEQVCTGQTGRKNPYRILDADYYKHAGPENIKEVLLEGYDDILIDFGSVKDGEHESYWRCDKKFLVGSFTEWQQESFREFEMENSREDFGSMQNGFRFQRMLSRSRRNAENFLNGSCDRKMEINRLAECLQSNMINEI